MTAPETKPVCLITGGSSGIGLATAMLFAKADYRIAICGRSTERLEAARNKILASGEAIECLSFQADLSDPSQVIKFAEKAIDDFGGLNVLVNNAADVPMAKFEEISTEAFEACNDTNIRGPFYLTQFVWKYWISHAADDSQRVVVNISSLAAVDPFPGFSLYGASKAWLDLLTLSLSQEGEAAGVRVCSIRPGAVETPMLRSLFPDFPAEQCVSPELIAEHVWKCVHEPENYPSGGAFAVTNQA